MIVRSTGVLVTDIGEVGPEIAGATLRQDPTWAVREERPGRLVLAAGARDTRNRPLLVVATFTDDRLVHLELTYAIRRPSENVHDARDPWEVARKDYQDAIVREWFQSSVHDLMYGPPPQPGPVRFRFPWGEVVSDEGGRGATVDVRYDDSLAPGAST